MLDQAWEQGMFTYRGKTALVTGAWSGIGETFARVLAQRGADLTLVVRGEDKLNSLAYELAQQHGVKTHMIAATLSREHAAQTVWDQTQGRGLHVDLLINAGFATYRLFGTLRVVAREVISFRAQRVTPTPPVPRTTGASA
jgi:short-subunit dehydrogenase